VVHRLIGVVGGRWDWYRQQADQSGLLFGTTPPDSEVDRSKFSPRLGVVCMPVERLVGRDLDCVRLHRLRAAE
jgi:outer membrane receptor protein involved in Fe transport